MFHLFKSPPKFPKIRPINIRLVKNYQSKFEESFRNFEEVQKELMHS